MTETEGFERAVMERLEEIQKTLEYLEEQIAEEKRERDLAEIRRKDW